MAQTGQLTGQVLDRDPQSAWESFAGGEKAGGMTFHLARSR